MNTTTGTGSRRRLWLAGGVVVIALGFLVAQGLGNATLYFRTADEAVAQRESLGDRRFRIQGDVVAGSISETGNDVTFTLAKNGVEVPVRHRGDPPELFQPGIPVVLEGELGQDGVLHSDRIIIRHTNEYRVDESDRLEQAEAEACDR